MRTLSKKKILKVTFLFVCCLLLVGCGKKPMYHVVVNNMGKKELDNVTLSYNKFEHNFGVLIHKADKGYMFAGKWFSLPYKATVTWQTPDKQWHKQIVDVKRVIPKNYKDIDICFNIINNNKVTVTFIDNTKN